MTAMTAGSALTADPGLGRDYLAPFPVNVPLTLSVHRHGGGDPAYAADAGRRRLAHVAHPGRAGRPCP